MFCRLLLAAAAAANVRLQVEGLSERWRKTSALSFPPSRAMK
jgi:hypothetical protein